MRKPFFLSAAAVAVLCAAAPVIAQTPVPAPTSAPVPAGGPTFAPQGTLTAPPLPSPVATSGPAVSAAPTPTPGRGKKKPAPTTSAEPTPSPPAFSTLDGDWEFVLSKPDEDIYGRLKLRQTGNTLAGTWRIAKKDYPVEGSYDGKSIRLTARRDNADWTLTGYVEGASDMVGIVTDNTGKKTVFTANHREKSKQELLIKP